MITIMIIVGIVDVSLICTALVIGIPGPYVGMVFPWVALVYYHFIAFVPVEVAVTWW